MTRVNRDVTTLKPWRAVELGCDAYPSPPADQDMLTGTMDPVVRLNLHDRKFRARVVQP